MVVHKHLIVRSEVKSPIISVEKAEDWLRRLVDAIGMQITEHGGPHCDYVKKDGNEGIAAIVMIETSHCSIHVWDKEDPPLVQVDVYSCADYDHTEVLRFVDEMDCQTIHYTLIDRGADWLHIKESV